MPAAAPEARRVSVPVWVRERTPAVVSAGFPGRNSAVTPAGRPATATVATASASTVPFWYSARFTTTLPPAGRTGVAGFAPRVKSVVPGAGAGSADASAAASTEPRPVAASYPGPAAYPVSPGTELLPVVTSWKAGEPAASGTGADALAAPYCARPAA